MGLEADRAKMFHWLDAAVADKDPEALYILADMYFHGTDGKDVNYERALQLYLEAGANRMSLHWAVQPLCITMAWGYLHETFTVAFVCTKLYWILIGQY